MNSRLRLLAVPLLAGVLMFAVPGGASAAPSGPIGFHVDYNVKVALSLPCSGLQLTSVGNVTAADPAVNHATWVSTECIDLLVHLGTFTVRDGHFVLTTTDGSTVSGTYGGGAAFTGILHLATHGVFALTGGTGTFAGATGCGNAAGNANLTNPSDNHLDISGHFGAC